MDVNLHRSFGQPASGAGQRGKAVTAGEILCEAGERGFLVGEVRLASFGSKQ